MPRESNVQPKLIDAQDVARLYGISERSVWRMCKRQQIPSPVRFDHRTTRWRLADLLAHIHELELLSSQPKGTKLTPEPDQSTSRP